MTEEMKKNDRNEDIKQIRNPEGYEATSAKNKGNPPKKNWNPIRLHL